MKYARYLLAMCLLAFAAQAKADWLSSDITDIINNVKAIYDEVTGNVKDTAQDLKRQLTSLQQQGGTVKETVDDALTLLQHRRTPFLDFVNGGTGRCGQGSSCGAFRTDLEDFVLNFADLKNRFPQIEKHGLGDGENLADIIDHMPPLVLFGVYEVFQRVPNWQDIPANLAALSDEIGDPDAFSLELPLVSPTAAMSVAKANAVPTDANFGTPETKTEIFCSQGKRPKWDDVRLNRLKAFFVLIKGIFDDGSEYAPDWYTLELVGEGADIPIPLKGVFKGYADGIDAILAAVDAHRANLGICKQIETDVAQRAQLVGYRTQPEAKKAFWVVYGILQWRKADGNSEATTRSLLREAGLRYGNNQWGDAYNRICDAYAAL